MTATIASGKVRVFAHAGVGGLHALRWADVAETHPQLDDWLAAGLVSRTGPKGEPPPDRLPGGCGCGR